MRWRFMKEALSRRWGAGIGYARPSDYQVNKVLGQMVASGFLVEDFIIRGHFRFRQWRRSEEKD